MQYTVRKIRLMTTDRWRILAFFYLLFVCHTSSGFPSSKLDVSHENIRAKRNIICFFGLTDIIKETLYASLLDVTQSDEVGLDDAWEGRLHDGRLRGLSTLTNLTQLRVFCDEGGSVVFSTTLRMRDAEVWYKWSRKVLFKFKGSVWLRAREVDFDLEVRSNDTTCGWKNFEVANSLVTRLDHFEVGFKGLGPLNPMVRKILKRKWKKDVSEKIGLLIKASLSKKLAAVSSSLEWMTFCDW